MSQTPWSPDFVAQTLELLIVRRVGAAVHQLRPVHADALRVGWSPGSSADEILRGVLDRYGLQPAILHSTSWRHVDDHVVLTYLAVVGDEGPVSEHLHEEPVRRVEPARGQATAAPSSIAMEQVLEHALRHLAWLLADDPEIAKALPDWADVLAPYLPEPFRGL